MNASLFRFHNFGVAERISAEARRRGCIFMRGIRYKLDDLSVLGRYLSRFLSESIYSLACIHVRCCSWPVAAAATASEWFVFLVSFVQVRQSGWLPVSCHPRSHRFLVWRVSMLLASCCCCCCRLHRAWICFVFSSRSSE